jgi:hypothetical protein
MHFITRVLHDTNLTPQCRWLVGLLIYRGEETIRMHEVYELAGPHYDNRQMFKIFQEAIKAGYVTTYKNVDFHNEGYATIKYTLTLYDNGNPKLPH